MKIHMKKHILAFLPIFLLAACTKDLTSLNDDPKNPKSVPSNALFTNAQHTLVNTLVSSNVNLNIWRLIVQQWQETTYTDESNYDLTTRSIPQGVWNTMYRDVLKDFEEAKKLIPGDVPDAAMQKNQLAILDIMEVYTWYYIVTTYGNVPYSQALNIDNTFPKYDDAKTIYLDLFARLDADLAALTVASESFGSADVIYGGDAAAWKLFANSLKLKMGITYADVDNAKAKSVVEAAAAAGVFTSNANNAEYHYLSGPPNTNPIWVDLVQSGRKDFVANKTLVDRLKAVNDPRLPFFFTGDGSSTQTTLSYSGGAPGASSNFATFSKPAGLPIKDAGGADIKDPRGKLVNADFPGLILDYSEVEFALAEARERGYTVPGTAAGHYNSAITASITYWGGTGAEATAYLLQPSVAYLTATGTYKQKIGTQKWIALYNRGWDAWIEQRRLDYPTLVAPATALSAYPLRYTYPTNEVNINGVNYASASTAIGGDKVTTKLFFDLF